MSTQIPRRTFLRGAGTLMALPLLEAMLPQSALAAPSIKKAPVRTAFLYVPNGVHMPAWTPSGGTGPLTSLPGILEPLESVKDHLLVMTGLTCDKARPNGDGPGDHARSAAAYLTGCQPRKTPGADIKAGISVDQYAAQQIGKNTRFASLELGCERGAQAGNCDSGYSCAYSSNIAWSSETSPVAKEVDPRLVFDRLFGNGNNAELAETRERRDRYKKSILDFVMDDAKALQGRLGVKDQQKLDEYFTGVREIEKRVDLAGRVVAPPKGVTAPTGIPQEYGDHIKLMLDMLALAFQADLTRVATFMFANEGSNRNYKNINVPEGHHELSHHGKDEVKQAKIQQINRFHVEQFAYFLNKLKSMPEAGGNVLDNSMILYGSGLSDGDRHNHDDLPVIMVGKGGGKITTGRHVVYPKDTPLNNLFLSMLDRMSVPVHSLGDSTGRLSNLT
ncbi:MAG: DUF1552 domain-containing protein [Actinomycetota bacterium]